MPDQIKQAVEPTRAQKSSGTPIEPTIEAEWDGRDRLTEPEGAQREHSSHFTDSYALGGLVDKARDYAAEATADNTNKAYAKDWAHYSSWCRRR